MKLTKKQKTQIKYLLAAEYPKVQEMLQNCISNLKSAKLGILKTKQSHYVENYLSTAQELDANKCLYLARKYKHILDCVETALLCDQVVEWLEIAHTNRQRIANSIYGVVDKQLEILSLFSEDRAFDGDLSDTNSLFQTSQLEEVRWQIAELNLLDELLEKIEKIVTQI